MRYSLIQKSWRQLVSATGLALAFALGAAVLAQPPETDAIAVDGRQPADQAAAAQNAENLSEDVEYLTRGPLHEAFAEPYEADPVAAPIVAAEPPEPIEELPPEYRPEGDNVVWISGYWAWDDEREDFLWVSGLWRELPPDQRWVPGYWVAADEGYRWISGFWAGTQLAEVQYLPMPPASLEEGPSAPAPEENHFYIPGHWVYQANGYQWRPGFWSPVHENWVWVPAQYIWTPRGTVFRPGYWDYDIAYRGIVFTPVYYRQPIYQSRQFVYRPRYTIDTGVNLLVHMFVRPNARQYYFGDYYGPQYANVYQPWIVRYQQPTFYDPFFAQYRYRTVGTAVNVLPWVTRQHQVFARSEQFRPARTIAAQQQLVQTHRDTDMDPTILRLSAVGEAIENIVEEDETPFRFRTLDREEQQLVRESARPMRELRQARQSIESEPVATELDADPQATVQDQTDADPQERRAEARATRRDQAMRGSFQLPAVEQTPAEVRERDRATTAEDVAQQQRRQPREDLPPGRQATELTPEEQRDRRTDARAATPPLTGETPAIGEAPGLAEERPGTDDERLGVAGQRRGVAGARPGVTGARPEDTGVEPGQPGQRPDATGPPPEVSRERPRAATPAPGVADQPPITDPLAPATDPAAPATEPLAPRTEQRPRAEQRPRTEQRPTAEQRPRGERQPGAADQRPAAEQTPRGVQRRPDAAEQRSATEQRPGSERRPAPATQRPAAGERRPGAVEAPPAAADRRDPQRPPAETRPRAGAVDDAARDESQAPTLPGTERRDPRAGERMTGDVRQIPGGEPGQGRARMQRMRPARPEGWPIGRPIGQTPRTLPTRPGAADQLGIPRGTAPGGRPEIGGAAADLQEGTVPRAGTLSPGGAPGVERGAPNTSGTPRSREAQPFTLPDLSDEEGLRQRR